MNNIDILEELINGFDNLISYKQKQAISTLIAENKEKDEEIENQDKTIDRLVKEQEEREKYTHQLEAENKELKEDRKKYTEEYIHNNPWLYKQLAENYILKSKVEEIIYKINEDIRRSDLRRTNATRTTAMEEEFKVKYSAETIKNILQSLLGKE